MSVAGKRSSQGDEYQLRVALHWLIRLLEDNSIQGIQVNSVGIPGQDFPVTVDDIVVLYKDGHACFIQAKKNQTDHKAWSLSDEKLKVELLKACEQLESRENSEVKFYSRSPFGELKALVELCQQFPDYSAFNRDAPGKQSGALKQLSNIIKRSEEVTFNLAQRVSFGPTYEFEDWDRENDANLDRLVPRADLVKDILERYLDSHETNLRDSKYVITREDVLSQLAEKGLSPTPKRSEAEILEAFKVASGIGRYWLRTIDGKPIPRLELSQLIALIEQGTRTILLTDRPGSGKTCLLLDLADYIEKSSPWGLLFIKGDQFTGVDAEQDLLARGLPEDIVGQCARLAGFRRVVVVIDSLDVLSLSRQHSALKVFLGLMDRLERVGGVTVIAACRSFDLEYDPLLRGRSWQQTVNLQPLDFESVVKPFLCDWGINPSSISIELQRVLQVPQNLRIYEKLAKLGKALQPASAYELYDSFLEEVVAKNSRLGDEALIALQNMAEHLMQQRSQSFPKVAFGASEDVVRELVSQEVLWEASPGVMEFSHQTLRDCLIVQATLAKKGTLGQFILDRPQLPFIRPAVRAFFFFLRAHQPSDFRRQVRRVLSHDEIAYHVKRLICESFAEIEPVEDDWRLLHWIFQNYPDLFRRLLSRVAGNAWFDILKQHWLPEVQISQNREDWLRQFCWQLSVWANQYPADVIALWREAIASPWADRQSLIGVVCSGLKTFEVWGTEGVRELLETLIEYAGTERDFLGESLSRWVQATNSGDELLWRYITRSVSAEDVRSGNLRNQLSCEHHEFHQEDFLAKRLCQSDHLLTLALNDLERWSTDSVARYEDIGLPSHFLGDTSWRLRGSSLGVAHPVDNLTILLNSLEKALQHRSRQNDSWWKANEPHLRATQEKAIRYFVIQAYKENIEANIPGIASHLRYRFGNLSSKNQWEPIAPLPECEVLAAALLNSLERYPIIWEDGQTVSQALEACCDVLDDPESTERLTLLLFWLRAKQPNGRLITNNEKNLVSIAINSIRGVVAESGMRLCNRLLEKGQPLPEILPFLLRHLARDSAIYVRVPILQQLPFLMYKQPDLGWQLLADVFHEPQPRLWKYAERCFYYEYRDNFDRVEPYLNRLLHEGMEEAGDTWGRISTLASLAGHLSQEQLFDTLATTNTDAWSGAAQVFGANLNRPEHRTICHTGLMTILGRGNLSNEIVQEFEQCFGEEANRGSLRFELARAFLETISAFAGKFYFHHFFDWLGWEAHRDPLSAMDLVEMLAEKLDTEMKPYHIGHTQPLIAALKEILSEADETDDPNLIQRAISLQDRFLRLDIYGIEELLAKAGQN
jgi:hypothetical protein